MCNPTRSTHSGALGGMGMFGGAAVQLFLRCEWVSSCHVLTLAYTSVWGALDGTVCVQNSKLLLQSAIPSFSEAFAAALVRF